MQPIIKIKRAYDEWFAYDPERWAEFQQRYKADLKKNAAIEPFREEYREAKKLTLIYAAKDEQHNHAIVLRAYLEHLFGE